MTALTRHLPLAAIVLSIPLFLIAALHYPGGTYWHADSIGFNVRENFVSALFQPLAINGKPSHTRTWAIPAMALVCIGSGAMFWRVARRTAYRKLGKLIEIFGCAAMVYTFLAVVTPLHDLLALLAALFLLVGWLALIRLLQVAGHRLLASVGWLPIALLIILGAMRHDLFRPDLAALAEWCLFALGTAWLACIYYAVPAPTNELPRASSPLP